MQQPQYHIPNSFGMFSNEKLLYDWRRKQGCCGSGGTHFTTLTDQRLLSRFEECVCCGCCCDPAHDDSSIFLHDIAQLLESTRARSGLQVLLTNLCVCCSCFCRGPKVLELRGSFGWQVAVLSKDDIGIAKPAIADAIARNKPSHQH